MSTGMSIGMRAPELPRWLVEQESHLKAAWLPLAQQELGLSSDEALRLFLILHRIIYEIWDGEGTGVEFEREALKVVAISAPDLPRFLDKFYDTNLRLAQSASRWRRIQRANKAVFPYLQSFTARDVRVRKHHRAFENIILEIDHPFWLDHFPPLGFGCRCQVIALTRGQFARRGLSLTEEADLAVRLRSIEVEWPPAFRALTGRRQVEAADVLS